MLAVVTIVILGVYLVCRSETAWICILALDILGLSCLITKM